MPKNLPDVPCLSPFVAALALVALGCASSPSAPESPGAPGDQQLVPYQPGQTAGITPQIEASTGRGDYALRYRVAEDGLSIQTGFIGPSEAIGAPLHMRTTQKGEWYNLVCSVARSDYQVTLARWRLDSAGQMSQASIRTLSGVPW